MIKILKSLFLSLAISTLIYGGSVMAEERDIIHMTLKDGVVKMETRPDLAPKHVAQIKQLISEGQYDGNSTNDKFNMSRAGTGGSNLPDIPAEFSDANHGRGAVSMARAQNPNSANSQFFIVFNDASFLDGQYTVWAQVTEGMELVDNITRGEPPQDPDKIIKMEIISE